MKKIIAILMTSLLVFCLCACGGGTAENKTYTAEDPLVFRFAHVEATDSILNQAALKFEEQVERESGGRIQVEVYANGELGSIEQTIEAIRAGMVQMTAAPTSNMSTYDQRLELLDLPFLFDSKEEMDAALNGEAGKIYEKWLEENGFYCAGYQYDGARGVSNSKHPVKTVKDMDGLKIRVMQSDIYIRTFQALGANPTPMSFTELYTGLQQGTVDGQDNAPGLTYINKFYEVQDYYSYIGIVYCNSIMLADKSYMENLPEDLFQIIQKGADECLVDYQRTEAFEMEEEYLNLMEQGGTQITRIEDKTEWRKTVEPVYEQCREEIGEEYVQQILDAVQNQRV
ncbi:DctP family TRAP transporter solute-binding subunit [Zhenpiania hominis]|uniref:DctP family TRAP transporter solute-binding subunit n=1 Tax=Zhenpiania hominis TaxID=2763644 RepID=UPI0039F60805